MTRLRALLLLLLLSGLMRAFRNRRRDRGSAGFIELFAAGVVQRRANPHVDAKALSGLPFVHSANRSDIAVVSSVGDANVSRPNRLAGSGIERHPASVRHEDFGPRMRSLPADHTFLFRIERNSAARNQISRDVAPRNPPHPRDAEQQMREILADARANR